MSVILHWSYSTYFHNWGSEKCFVLMHTLIPQMFMEHAILTHSGSKFQGHKQESLSICLGAFGLLEQNAIHYVAYTQQKFISYSSGGWKSEIRLVWLGSGESSFLGCGLSISCILKRQNGKTLERSLEPFSKALILFRRAPPSWGIRLPKAPPWYHHLRQ